MMSLRTPKMEAKYQKAIKEGTLTPLWELPAIRRWECWSLVENDFPHDRKFSTHHLIVLRREGMKPTGYEIRELQGILEVLDNDYHYFKLNAAKLRTINNCFHIHAVICKDGEF